MKSILFILPVTTLFLLTNILPVHSQVSEKSGGRISGIVTDKKNNEPLVGATVKIQGSSMGAVADIDGIFLIKNVPAGKYTVEISNLSYNKKIIHDVEVKENETVTLNISLEESASEIETVVITASVNKETTTSLLLFQQKSVTLVDGISSEVIKRSPDKNTSEVLKRISGATIQDNKFAIIRGLSDRYNTYLINEMPLPTTEPDKKAFSFDIFPSGMLDNMLVFKTASPDLPGDFSGGAIQVNTRDIPEQDFLSISIGTGYNTQSTGKAYRTYKGGDKDWLGIDDGTRNFPENFPSSSELKALLTKPETRDEASKIFKNDWAINTVSYSPWAQSYHVSGGKNMSLFRNDLGIIGSLTYSNSRKTIHIERGDFDADTSRLYKYNDVQYKQNTLVGGMLNFAYKIGTGHKISWKNIYTINGEDMVTERNGIQYNLDRYEKATVMQFTSSSLFSSQLSGEHLIPSSKIKIRWGCSANKTHRDIPNLRRLMYTQQLYDTIWYAAVQQGSPSPNYAGMFYSDLYERSYSGNTDVTVPFRLLKQKHNIKIGAFAQNRKRHFDARVFGYVIANPMQFDWNLLTYGQDSIFNPENMGDKGFRLKEATNPSDSYKAQTYVFAGYAMFDNHITKKIRAMWGVRTEQFDLMLSSNTYGGDTVQLDTTYYDILPSLNLVYSVTDISNFRVSFSKTLARPELRELAPFSFFDFNTYSAVVGNHKLVPTQIYNYDVRYEVFPGNSQILSVSVFYKNFNSPIENIAFYGGSGSRSRSYQNVKRATNYGIETEYRLKLNWLDSLFETKCFYNFTFNTNIAIIRSNVDLRGTKGIDTNQIQRPLQGQSPYIINAGLLYVHNQLGTGISILYNKIGRRIFEVGSNGYPDVYEAPRDLLDVQFSQKFFKKKRLEFKFTIADLFNNESVFYQDQNKSRKYEKNKDTKIAGMKYGRNYSFGLAYSF